MMKSRLTQILQQSFSEAEPRFIRSQAPAWERVKACVGRLCFIRSQAPAWERVKACVGRLCLCSRDFNRQGQDVC